MSSQARPDTRLRWWPAAVVAVASAGALAWVWLPDGGDGQFQVMATVFIALATLLLLATWLIFFSRLSRSRRRLVIGAVLAALAVAVALLRIRGVTGDLAPIVEFRWTSRATPALQSSRQ